MKDDTAEENNTQKEDPIVIPDECGDSIWDAVLAQEVKACQIAKAIHNPDALINKIETEESVENDNDK
jgi:hypothetical protein